MRYDQTKTRRWQLVGWLRANPGLHFGSDIADAMGLALGSDGRRRLLNAARQLAYEGAVRAVGTQATKRYGYLRDLRPMGNPNLLKQEAAA